MNYFEKQSKANICLIDDKFEEAIYLYQECIKENPDISLNYFKLGLVFLLLGEISEAQEIWLSCIAQADIDKISELTKNLTTVLEAESIQRFGNEKIDQAELIIHQILEIDPQNAKAYKHLGNVHLRQDRIDEAIDYYRQSLSIDPIYVDSHKQLGNALFRKGNLQEAISSYQEAININPNQIDVLFNLGVVLQNLGNLDEAEDCYKKSIRSGNKFHQCFQNLGKILEIKGNNLYSSLYNGLSFYYRQQYEEAVEKLNFFIKENNNNVDEFVFTILFFCYEAIDDFENAIEVTKKWEKIYPGNYILKLKSKLFLPVIYQDKNELNCHRNRVHENLNEILQNAEVAILQDCKSILTAISEHVNFYLAYQCEDDTAFQKAYGSFIHKVMSAQFPEWQEHRSLNFDRNRKIKIGYVSYHFKYHTISKYFLGWVKYANVNEFEIFTYYTGELRDFVTQEFITHSDHFYDFSSSSLEEICNQINENALDILVYTDIGMHARLTQLAALRLAPIQCSAWGHPVTSGLSTIDYYLSCDHMEPENAQEHYLEPLIRLPNIGVAYDKPKFPYDLMQRDDFGIRLDATVYLSCQSVFKYLPQYDYIFPRIVEEVPNAQLVFVDPPARTLASKFKQRIKTAFDQYHLDYEEYCLFLPRQDREGYVNLNLVSDIFLDTLGWSGGNTSLEAIAYGLPVVTFPGQFMRGRQSYGFLKFIDVTDTIANSEEDYIRIAIKLGLDRQWRNEILQKIGNRQHLLFEDTQCVEALEDFYRSAIENCFSKALH
jgi:protein O-GlcNAc transferase